MTSEKFVEFRSYNHIYAYLFILKFDQNISSKNSRKKGQEFIKQNFLPRSLIDGI